MNKNIILSPISIDELKAHLLEEVGMQVEKKLDDKLNGSRVLGNRLLSMKDVINFLGVSRGTLYNFREEGRLKFYKVGSKVRFKERDVLALVEG